MEFQPIRLLEFVPINYVQYASANQGAENEKNFPEAYTGVHATINHMMNMAHKLLLHALIYYHKPSI